MNSAGFKIYVTIKSISVSELNIVVGLHQGSRAKGSFYGRMIISMILIISIFQSLAASTRTAWAQKVRTVGVHVYCVLPYTHL